MDDVSNEEVDAVEFTRVSKRGLKALDPSVLQMFGGALKRVVIAIHAIDEFGADEDMEAAADALKRIAAKAMRRKS
jgi:hypothetical protein